MAHFAGSQNLDERRRRRLAADADGPSKPSVSAGAKRRRADSPLASPPPTTRSDLTLAALIPRQIWKYWAASAIVLTIGSAILWASQSGSVLEQTASPNVAALFGLRGLAIRCFGGVSLLLAAQSAALLAWLRARSLEDFQGRYRIWRWTTLLVTGMAGFTLLDLSTAYSLAAQPLLPFESPTFGSWFIPALLVGGILFGPLRRDLRGCRSSFILMHAAIICYLAAAAWETQVVRGGFPISPVATAGLWIAGHAGLLLCGMFHLRHVVHVDGEPPQATTPVIRLPKLRWLRLRRVRLPKLRLPRLPRVRKQPAQPHRQETASSSKVAGQRSKTTAPLREQKPAAPEKCEPPPKKSVVNHEQLKGMSKKERRRLRKEKREAERQLTQQTS